MIYAYIRVSTDRQTVENQRYEVEVWAKKKDMVVEEWAEETISGTKKVEDRVLGVILEKIVKDDILIVSELSRIGRNLMEIMNFLHNVMKKEAVVFAVKEGYELGNNITSKVLAFAFALSAEIERNLIVQRTTEALNRRQATGLKMGRPKGKRSTSKTLSCAKHTETIQRLLDCKTPVSAIARIIGVHRITLTDFLSGKRGQEEDVDVYIAQKIESAKTYIAEKMPDFKNGDIGYLKKNREDFIALKNEGYSYSNLSIAMGIDMTLLQGLFH